VTTEEPSQENGEGLPPPRRHLWLLRALSALLFALALWAFWGHWDQEWFEGWQAGANPLLFFALLAILPLLFVPLTPFFLVAGATFPTWMALLGSATALAANCLLNYGLARAGWLRWMRRWVSRSETTLLHDNPRRILQVATLIKLAPGLPTVVKNSILAVSGMPFLWYFILSWGLSMIYAVILIVLGDSIVEADLSQMVIAVIALATLGAAMLLARRLLDRSKP
jgi:uncharacterized membrane protein YdjX (TVP38/TMEM64 family)